MAVTVTTYWQGLFGPAVGVVGSIGPIAAADVPSTQATDAETTAAVAAEAVARNVAIAVAMAAGPPQMTEAARDLLTPALGLWIVNTTTSKLNFCNGVTWEVVTSA
jgi:hypothetical protein